MMRCASPISSIVKTRSIRIGSLPAATRSTYRWNADAGRSELSPPYAVSRSPFGRYQIG
jgi:hypothetical protein